MNIPNDASISRTHATFTVHAEAGGVTVCDTSKFGVHVDGVRLDPKNATGEVVLCDAPAATTCVVAFGCAKPVVYEAKLVYTPSDAQPVGGDDDDDATTDGDETDAVDRAVEGAPEPTDAEDENETIIAIFKCGALRSFVGRARAIALNGLIRKIKKARNGPRTEKDKKKTARTEIVVTFAFCKLLA